MISPPPCEPLVNSQTSELSTISCPLFLSCSGCQIQKNVQAPPLWSEIQDYFFKKEIAVPLISDEITHWRTRTKLAVRGTPADPQIGLFERGTHRVIDIDTCPLHHPRLNEALSLLRKEMILAKVVPFDEQNLKGVLRYIQMVVHRKTGTVQLTLVVNSEEKSLTSLLTNLARYSIWHSIWVNHQQGSTNRILGDRWELKFGEHYLCEELAGIKVYFHPATFAQAHLNLFEKMLFSLQKEIEPSKHVVELYAGVGAIGLSVAARCASLHLSEINPFSRACFLETQKHLPSEVQQKVSFHVGSVENALFLLEGAEVLIVDPPRKGLDPSLLKAIASSESLEQIIYISCGWRSFHRDCECLLDAGWSIDRARGYLFFPGTDHVEILCIFKKSVGYI